MAKGDITLVNCMGSVGSAVTDFTTKQVVAGQYRHTQTVKGKSISWKCGMLRIDGTAKVVEDAFTQADGTVVAFFRMEGLATSVEEVSAAKATFDALSAIAW